VLFAHEVILGHYARRSFVPIVIASVGGTVFSRLWFGNIAAFDIPDYQITSYWEIPAFVLLGLTCAVVSVLFQFALVSTDYVARLVSISLYIRPIIGGLLIGAIALLYPQVLGVGYEATDQALRNQLTLEIMLGLLVAKTAATAITLAPWRSYSNPFPLFWPHAPGAAKPWLPAHTKTGLTRSGSGRPA